jgi:signal transduction histidine kinase
MSVSATSAAGPAPSILIVDDNPANRRLYDVVLRGIGAEVFTATTGEQAVAHCAERRFAMILLDVHLSGMSGFDVALALRQTHAVHSPIVFVSAVYTHESHAFEGYRLGAVDYILSPVVPAILRAKAEAFIRLDRMRREAEEQALAIATAYRELRSAHTDLEHFSFTVSHDLRTPLGQIAGFADLLQRRCGAQLDDTGRRYLGLISDAASRMDQLIDDLLVLAGLSRRPLDPEPVDLSELARERVAELMAQAPQSAAEWVIANGLVVQGDLRLLRAALSNLLGNAFKYSAEAEPPHIEFTASTVNGEPVFCVRDNGAGFDPQAAGERLFKPFQRFHPESDFAGTGIGLAIVERAIARHGGRIWAESRPGEGASFFFTLPPLPEAGGERPEGPGQQETSA